MYIFCGVSNMSSLAAGEEYSDVSPRAVLRARVGRKLEEIVDTLKTAGRQEESVLVKILDWLSFAFCNDIEAAYEFGVLGGHNALLKLLGSKNENVVAAAGDAIDSCSVNCAQFPMSKGLSIDDEDRRRPLEFLFEPLKGKKVLLRIVPKNAGDISSSDGKPNSTVGYYLWDAAIKLAWWIVRNGESIFRGKTVLEVGSGVGLCGVLASAFAKRTYITDFHPKIVATAKFNILLNSEAAHVNSAPFKDECCISSANAASAVRCDWDKLEEDTSGIGERTVDVIVGSDVICEESDCLGVARMLDRFLTETGTGYFVLGSDANRYGVDKFSSIIASQGFDISSMDEAISGEDCSTFLRKNQNFNSRPHDKLEMFVVKRIS